MEQGILNPSTGLVTDEMTGKTYSINDAITNKLLDGFSDQIRGMIS